MNAVKKPAFWLYLWGGLGALALVYFIIAASVQPRSDAKPSARNHDASLLVGQVSDFQYAFPPRGASNVAFLQGEQSVSLADFRGKAVLVNFWATWCAPCLRELPSLDQLQGRLGGDQFEVVAIAADPSGTAKIQNYLDRLNIENLQFYADPQLQMATSFGGANILPLSVLYDASGNEVGRVVGEVDWMSPEAVQLVESAL